MLSIKQIPKEDTYPLRIEILRNGKAVNYHFVGDNLKTTIHIGVFTGKACIGIVTLIPNSHKSFPKISTYQLRGMAIDKAYQKQGIGSILVEESLKILNETKCEILWCNARVIALEFYKKMGFSIQEKKFEIPTVGPHYMMYLALSR